MPRRSNRTEKKTKNLNNPPKIPFKYLAIATQVLPTLGLIAGIILAIYTGFGLMEITLLLVMLSLVIASLEAGAHWMFAHRSFRAHKSVTAIFGIFFSMATQGPILYWVMHHKRHHRHSDTKNDPHSPHAYPGSKKRGLFYGLLWAHFFWIYGKETLKVSHDISAYRKEGQRLVAHTRYPNIIKISNNYWCWVFLGILIPAVIGGVWAGTWLGVLKGALWGGVIRIWLGQLAIWGTNSFSHHFGSRQFNCKDRSTNNWFFALFTLGNWHNNHHALPNSARTGLKWWQIDVCWWIILLLEKIGLAHEVKRP